MQCLDKSKFFFQNFQMTVTLPGLEKSSQTLKIRLLPGKPAALRLISFSDGFNKIERDNGRFAGNENRLCLIELDLLVAGLS